MNFVENLKSNVEEYKLYKTPRYSMSLISEKDIKKRNIFKFVQLKSFGRKYGDALYKHFKIVNDIESYELLINLFGKKNIERALSNQEATTAQIADILLETGNIEFPSELQNNFVLEDMQNSIAFNRATDLNLSDFDQGINPVTFKRKALNNRTMLDIFKENEITKDVLKEIYEMYGNQIISCYNNDSYLRNKTILKLDGKYKKSATLSDLQDHVTYYSEDDFNTIFQKYFNSEELSETEQYILLGLLAKECDLIGAYSIKHLREHPEYIKSEIDVGIFNDIVVSGKTYTNDERKKIATLSKVWDENDLNRFNNLELLKQRLASFPKTQEILDTIQTIDEILSKPLSEITIKSNEIAEFMDSAFMDYEVENRTQIIENVYNPEKTEEIIITDLSQMDSAAMLHFFSPGQAMSNFEDYVKDLEEKRSEELGKKFEFSQEEKKGMLLQYKNKENHYITDYALDFEGIGQVGTFDTIYATNTSNQLCAMITTPKEILEGKSVRGTLAIGLSKETVSPELIATTSNKNIHSNKGIDYVESNNTFKDFSASYSELITDEEKAGGNTEVVLFRNSYQASLKPSYIMYVGNDKLDSTIEKENIALIKEQMKEAGLKVPLVIFDRYSIMEKMKNGELEQNQRKGIDER